MSKVTECARALGQAILESEEYQNMQLTDAAASADPRVAAAMGRYLEIKGQLDEAMGDGDPNKISALGRELDEIQQEMNNLDVVEQMTTARQHFSEMMNQINQILEFMITGEVASSSGCSGNCSGCSGCH